MILHCAALREPLSCSFGIARNQNGIALEQSTKLKVIS
jgi:hypothetical protein